VKLVHRIEPRAQTVRRDQYVNVVRKFLLDRRVCWLAFVASHSLLIFRVDLIFRKANRDRS
jgi:hypothetical protein